MIKPALDSILKCKFICAVKCKSCEEWHKVWSLKYEDIGTAECPSCGHKMKVENKFHFC